MRFSTSLAALKRQLHRLRFAIGLAAFGSLLILAIGVLLQLRGGISIRFLLRDVTAIGDLPVYAGALSNLGIILWGATATICYFGAALAKRLRRPRSTQRFLFCSGLLTTLLLVDDWFQIHEDSQALLGISEELFFVLLGALLLVYMAIFARQILKTDFLLLLLTSVIFAFSLTTDAFPLVEIIDYDPAFFLGARENQFFVEDGSKLVGICFWLSYFAHTTAAIILDEA